ncbi:hypothetical protein WJX84_005541 [Apatococcus fuscideae]|uniref:Large ribosomal subunit protein uL22c n=1 Tax=Apatococcus fuscideae TaxID=2026836 RepID=A0AAW1T132_9CHLO
MMLRAQIPVASSSVPHRVSAAQGLSSTARVCPGCSSLSPRLRQARPLVSLQAAPVAKAATAATTGTQAVAVSKWQKGSVHKVRRVLDTIRGRSYEEALMILEYSPYRACELITKTLVSAASNAKHNHGMSKVKLYVSEAFADEAMGFKRLSFRAMGRAYKIKKPNAHLTIKVKERSEA